MTVGAGMNAADLIRSATLHGRGYERIRYMKVAASIKATAG
jgi:hypothetical protein